MAICKKCSPKIKEFLKKFDEWLLKNVDIAVNVTNVIKGVIDNPVIDIITAAIPGDLDDSIKRKTRAAISFALDKLIMLDTCNKADTVELRLVCYTKFLAGLPAAVKDANLFKFSSLIATSLDEYRYQQHEYDTAVQLFYSANKK